jgi:DNA invertase Pin-like site-specific DNA recombinase
MFNETILLNFFMIIGYVRVSTKDQNLDLQVAALKKVGVEKIFEDKMSAIKERPQLDKMLEFCRAGDTVVVWKMDRIARNLGHLIEIVERLKEKKVDFISLTEKIDTTTPLGYFFLHITGAFSQLERSVISERTIAGLQSAREKGRIGGRRKGLSKEAMKKAEAIKTVYTDESSNLSMDEICDMFGIGSKATLYRYLKALDVNLNKKRGRKIKKIT